MGSTSVANAPFWERLKGFFLKQADQLKDDGTLTRTGSSKDDYASFIDPDDFSERLKSTVGAQDTVTAARVGIINLEAVKQKMGDRWPKLSARIHTLVAKIIEKRLNRNDFYSRLNEATYLIVFGDEDTDSAHLKGALLGKEVMHTLFGASDAFEDVDVVSAIGEADVDTLKRGGFSQESFLRSFEDAMAQQMAKNGDTNTAPAAASPTTDLERGLERAKKVLSKLPTNELDAKASDPEHIRDLQSVFDNLRHLNSIMRTITDNDAELRDWAEQYRLEWGGQQFNARDAIRVLATEAGRKIEEVSDPWEAGGGTITAQFEPVLYRPSKTIGLFRVNLSIELPGDSISYRAALKNADDTEFITGLDRATFQMGIGELRAVIGTEQTSAIALPVSFRTLSWPRGQREYLGLCRTLSPTLKRLIVWEIHDVPLDAWAARLGPMINLLKPHGRMVSIRLSTAQPNPPNNAKLFFRNAAHRFGSLSGAGARCVLLSAKELPGPEADRLTAFDMLAEAADKHGLHLALEDLSSLSLVIGAIGAGAHYISGPAISDPQHHLSGVETRQITDLYERRLGKMMRAVG